jgi:hypothetical protein
VAANTGRGRRLYDLRKDPEERRNVARGHPHLIDELEERVREAAGGPLPSYDGRGRLRRVGRERPRRDGRRRRRD